MKQFLIPTNKGNKVVMMQNIIRVEASSSYCKIYFSNEYPLIVAKVLHWFEDQLPGDMFCRIHRGHIVNRSYITAVSQNDALKLSNGDVIQMSRRKKQPHKVLLPQTA